MVNEHADHGAKRFIQPTLRDVAERAGVSTATVSRCLNTPDRVVEKTREKVLRAVHDLGYAPNFSARALAAKSTNTIGAIVPTMENAIFARALQAFQEELDRNGFTLLLASSSYRADLEAQQIKALAARGVDGLLLIGHDREQALYSFLDERELPHVVAWSFDRDAQRVCVGFDNYKAMSALMERVMDYGHKRIGLIAADIVENDRSRERVAAVFDTARRRVGDAAELRSVEVPYSIASGRDAFLQLMAEPEPPTVVVCGNDVLAAGALEAARHSGLRVPQDVSITGFDDLELARVCQPMLTTVHVPHREMGRCAAQQLVRSIKGGGPAHSQELQVTVEERETLGPAATS